MSAAKTVRQERQRTNDDLCTPDHVLSVIRQLGPIVLDPCSNPWSTVGARVELDGSEGRDGLTASWVELAQGGLVFVNPPYGRGHMPKWAEKIAVEADFGAEIVALVPASTDTSWWRRLRKSADAICLWDGRISFVGGRHGSGMFASAFFYCGHRPYLFCHEFHPYGDVRCFW